MSDLKTNLSNASIIQNVLYGPISSGRSVYNDSERAFEVVRRFFDAQSKL
jgi:hypothetical protein